VRPTGPSPEIPSGRLAFVGFELRLDTGELTHQGQPVKLQPQPARLLRLLALRTGEAVSREEIHRQLWGEDTFLEVEPALNFAVRQVRRALGDSATEPRFVETLPRFGYRFLPPVQRIDGVPREATVAGGRPRWQIWAASAASAALLAGLGVLALGGVSGRREGPRGTSPPQAAYEAYLEGLYLSHETSWLEHDPRAVALLERAVALAPDFAPAWGELALARLDFLHQPTARFAAGVEGAARQALRLDPANATAHRALGNLALFGRFDLGRARQEMERALTAAPGSAEVHHSYADALAALGQLDAAIAEVERARQLDPAGMAVRSDLVWYHYLARQYDPAIEEARLADRIDPDRFAAPLYWILSYVMKKDDAAALRQAQALVDRQAAQGHRPPPPRLPRLHDFWAAGLARLSARRKTVAYPPTDLAVLALALGERDRALGLLKEACEQHFGWMLPFLASDPLADPLRGDPRFARILRCAGHPGPPL
jgi:DNA-binding winged helix-turn-helix (wHTH) protein/tetratricopeptide (TPR) repeat protein